MLLPCKIRKYSLVELLAWLLDRWIQVTKEIQSSYIPAVRPHSLVQRGHHSPLIRTFHWPGPFTHITFHPCRRWITQILTRPPNLILHKSSSTNVRKIDQSRTNQIKSNQIKSNQIKSNQIKSPYPLRVRPPDPTSCYSLIVFSFFSFMNQLPIIGLVSKSAGFLSPGIHLTTKSPSSTHSLAKWCLRRICLVRRWKSGYSDRVAASWLSL